MNNYKEINRRTMEDTVSLCESVPELKDSIKNSIAKQKIYWESEQIQPKLRIGHQTKIIVSHKTTLDAAEQYAGEKVGVLNFANHYHVGGSPFTAAAQEETLCHCTTLYPCINSLRKEYYEKHKRYFKEGRLDFYGNDDAIFTPGITVIKDSRSEPHLKDKNDWFSIDVITSAAPKIKYQEPDFEKLEQVFAKRIKRILDIAEAEGEEVLILGAFGCGAFGNPPELVAKVFKDALGHYSFKVVEFAIKGHGEIDQNYIVFADVFKN